MSSQLTVTVDDSSPLFNYLPHGDGGVGDWTQTGWQPWFSDSGGFNSAGGNDGVGTSYHVTAFAGARLDLQFYGTGIALFGNGSCPYQVSLDGTSQSFSSGDGQLFSQDGLEQKMHNISLTANASTSNTFWFDRADISRTVTGGTPTSVVYAATNTTFMQYSGGWQVQNDPNGQIPSKANPAPYYEADTPPASVTFSFQGTGIAVNGSRNWGSGVYDVSLDGNVDTYNASTMWLIGDTLLFYQEGLDASATHTVNITPKLGGGFKFWLNSVTILADGNATASGVNGSSTGSPSSAASQTPTPTAGPVLSAPKKVNVGVIVGPIIGGIVLLAIIAAFAVFYHRRRRVASAAFKSAQYAPYVLPPSPTPLMQDTSAGAVVSPLPTPSKLAQEANSPYATMRPAASGSSSAVSPPPPGSVQSSAGAPSPSGPAPPTGAGAGPVPSGGSSEASSTPSAADSHAAVDRLIQIIADRIDRTHPPRPAGLDYGPDVPPPEYGA